jgi:ABC-type branched-subunit amino acid transport system substrate-binding protein
VTRTVTAVQTQPATQVVTRLVTVTAAPTTVDYTIGFAMAVSGPCAVDGPVRRDGGILAMEHINEYLKSIGSPVRFKYVHDDTKGTAADALKAVQSMYAAGIRVIVGPFDSGEVRGVMDFANTNKIVIISPSSTSPVAGVAVPLAHDIFRALLRINKELGTTFVIIEHRLDVLFEYVQRVMVMHEGRLIYDGDPQGVFKDSRVVEAYLGGEVT